MTDTQNEQDKQRKPFERFASDDWEWPKAIERAGDGYKLIQTNSAWIVWQAAISHAAQAKQWQPIETAPKDCNVLLYYPLRGAIRGKWKDDEYAKNPKPYWRHDHAYLFGTGEARTNQPTHWMPLPDAPKETTK